MGDAKRRGTYEQRKAAAIAKEEAKKKERAQVRNEEPVVTGGLVNAAPLLAVVGLDSINDTVFTPRLMKVLKPNKK